MPETVSAASGAISGTILAFDFGEKRIGVAVGESSLRQAHPLTVIQNTTRIARFAAIAALIDEWKPVLLVVGLPTAHDGTAHEMTQRCTRFGNQLRGRFNLPVDFVDERFTSIEAESLLRASGRGTRKTKPHVDAVAAQVILQSYLETPPVVAYDLRSVSCAFSPISP
ncbi:MAG: Holliday junction resolvase RuvX [Betaproteobacteria bacterium]|nr:Holliday junction resolvase RuvX [Betaproteobacteria bacterium]